MSTPNRPDLANFALSQEEFERISAAKSRVEQASSSASGSNAKASRVGCTVSVLVGIGSVLGAGFASAELMRDSTLSRDASGWLGIALFWIFMLAGLFVAASIYRADAKRVDAALNRRSQEELRRFGVGKVEAYDRYKASLQAYEDALSEARRRDAFAAKVAVEYWRGLSGIAFEREFAEVLRALGYSVQVTPPSNDGGIDIRAWYGERTIIIQCKAWTAPVPPSAVRELQGVREPGQEAWIVGLGGFTSGAVEFGTSKCIKLVGLNEVLELAARASESLGGTSQPPRTS
jgi:uncharacterized protein YjeT (DUF2065 family)